MKDHDVCSDDPLQEYRGRTVKLTNYNNPDDVNVKKSSSCPWPFQRPAVGFTIKATKSTNVVLRKTPGKNYCYETDGCPNDRVNPKTVIIT